MNEKVQEEISESLRTDLGMTAREFATKLDKNEATICRWLLELTMPLSVFLAHVLMRGKLRTIKLLAHAAGYRLEPIAHKKSLKERVQELLNDLLKTPLAIA